MICNIILKTIISLGAYSVLDNIKFEMFTQGMKKK